VSAEELEKIPSPEQIKLFKVVKKENGALYGVRLKQNNSEDKISSDSMQSEKLEKISSPEEIKLFKVIKKENGALYGIKLSDQERQKKEDGGQDATKLSRETKLEKIPTANDISFFEKIKKIGNALWGVKKQMPPYSGTNSAIVDDNTRACVITTIDTKDTAVKDLIAKQSTDRQQTITERNTCQKAAFDTIEKQKTNLAACAKNFKEANVKIQNEYKQSHQTIWKSYLTSLKECSKLLKTDTSDNESKNSEILIEDGDASEIE